MENWFTLDQIDTYTHIISEYRHWEETHCYLLEGSNVFAHRHRTWYLQHL